MGEGLDDADVEKTRFGRGMAVLKGWKKTK